MSFINSYKPALVSQASRQDQYDVNSNIRIPPYLETERDKLVPFLPSTHAVPFFTACHANPSLKRYLSWNHPTIDYFYAYLASKQADPTKVLFAVIDKTKPNQDADLEGSIAGVIGIANCTPSQLSAELGPVVILPAFQRTFVSSNAAGLLLRYLLDTSDAGGLGFRRVTWSAFSMNVASNRFAERLGFKQEGTMRWKRVIEAIKEGISVPEERGGRKGCDALFLSICWDDWEGGVRDLVTKQMDRV